MSVLGRLNLEAFQHDIIVMGAVATMLLAIVAIIAGLTYFKKWRWLWENYITTVDHKKIGIAYIVVSFVMLVRGFADALMLKGQQAVASGSGGFLSADHFQQIFSAHGTLMIFFVAMGLMFGIINVVLPLQLGARDVAFPVLNAISFWLFAGGMILMNTSLIIGEFSNAGWLAYPPLSGIEYNPGVGVDYWIWSLQIAGLGSLLSGVNFLTTILKKRAPGMSLMKMPIFAWTVMGSMILVIFSFPILTATLFLLTLDRTLGMNFFTSTGGGNPMMYINLIWAWGHPEVYILMLPGFGIFSEIVATFSRKRIFGYSTMVWAIVAITFFSYVVWLHHFFTMGAGANVNAFFGIMTMIIAIPTGVKVFNWLFTMYKGRVSFPTPMIWFLGFIVTFTIGGVTGVLMSVPAIDFQVHNSLFLVAHFHNMVIGGVVFSYLAGLTYWFPKIFGFKLNEKLGTYSAWCWIVGFAFTFIPIYALGIMGATRRLNTYDASLGWQGLFIVSAIGVTIIGVGVALTVLQLVVSVVKRKQYRDTTGDPWDGRTLEWATSSPAKVYNFAVIPKVYSRDAYWEQKSARATKLDEPRYSAITLPKNTSFPFIVAMLATLMAFAIVWYIWWLAVLSLVLIIATVVKRSFVEETEYVLPAKEVMRLEQLA
ncbi:cytochrome o ubiquinol oxidase subunit I [Candidatus Nomurabacteria bacterium]|jgi:cytochrome o ubiquinol oxidase subunit 1|nr:cytochrome o ubiquinol oxidase subunit I [Candidatus Saccharibacteria bacterium]MCB9839716.1 cytochrome o ubiquinol oxidase subunit I [Candidatus Nomurabacteria bacterium]